MAFPTVTGLPLPRARGPLSQQVRDALSGRPVYWPDLLATAKVTAPAGVLCDEDAQITLLMLFELHYRGISGVSESWEWDPDVLAVRGVLEDRFETEIRDRVVVPDVPADGDVAGVLFRMTAPSPGPSLSRYLARTASQWQFREFLAHRSVYHLKEADPHTWAIPRLAGAVKAAMVEVQADEYGGGRAERVHSALFAQTMRALGLDDTYGALVDRVPGVVLAGANAMSLFGLHRRLLGAIVGHLAAFEMTSSLPNRSYGDWLRRLGFGPEATLFFDEHVEADAVHEQIAGRDLAGGLAATQPERAPDILFGAAAGLLLDDLAAEHLRSCWDSGRSSLLPNA